MKIAIIMRGIPGSGKSTKAKELAKKYDATICSADDFFESTGKYVFDVKKIGEAHKECFAKFSKAIKQGKNVIVDNTNLKPFEVEKYLDALENTDYKVCIFEVTYNNLDKAIEHRTNQETGKNIPSDKIKDMYNTFFHVNLKKEAKEYYPKIDWIGQKEL